MKQDQSFTGQCPTCGQPYLAEEIERLRSVAYRATNDRGGLHHYIKTQDAVMRVRTTELENHNSEPRAELVEAREVAVRNATDCGHLRQSAIALKAEVERLRADRNEWQTQHDNLLAMYQRSVAEVAALKTEWAEHDGVPDLEREVERLRADAEVRDFREGGLRQAVAVLTADRHCRHLLQQQAETRLAAANALLDRWVSAELERQVPYQLELDTKDHLAAQPATAPTDGTCMRCGSAPVNAANLCATCVDELEHGPSPATAPTKTEGEQ